MWLREHVPCRYLHPKMDARPVWEPSRTHLYTSRIVTQTRINSYGDSSSLILGVLCHQNLPFIAWQLVSNSLSHPLSLSHAIPLPFLTAMLTLVGWTSEPWNWWDPHRFDNRFGPNNYGFISTLSTCCSLSPKYEWQANTSQIFNPLKKLHLIRGRSASSWRGGWRR